MRESEDEGREAPARKTRRARTRGGRRPHPEAGIETAAHAVRDGVAGPAAEADETGEAEVLAVPEEVEAEVAPVEKVLLVNAADPEEVRIALLEDGQVEELYVEAPEERSSSGNVYRGRVQNVERAIGAAFVDLGKGLTGFLHVSDLPDRTPGASITEVLEPGQEVLVQVTRDRMGRKGPALSGRIALAGRHLVLLATTPRSGVSRRISRGRNRDRIRRLLSKLDVPEGMGLIVRTAGEDAGRHDLQRDLAHLVEEWAAIQVNLEKPGPPGLLRAESDLAERSVRDIMPADVSRIVTDRPEVAERIREILRTWYGPPRGPDEELDTVREDRGPEEHAPLGDEAPVDEAPVDEAPVDEVVDDEVVDDDAAAGEDVPGSEEGHVPGPSEPGEDDDDVEAKVLPAPEVGVHEDRMPLFHTHGVEQQLEEAFRRSLRLPSGGSVVIDPTEALIAIDVNSGRATAEEDPDATALATNLEAVEVVARQLRLRDLGGLVVVDLIDMRERRNDRKVERAFKRALARDRARIRLGRIGPFGCVTLSRQRIRKALSRVTHEDCPECGGTGRRRHHGGLGLRVLREMQARVARARGRGGLEARVPKSVHDWIRRHRGRALKDLGAGCTGPVRLAADDRLPLDGWAMKGLPPTERKGGDKA